MVAEFVTVETAESIATIRLHRPPVNELSLAALREVAVSVREVSADSDTAAIVMYGGEKVFAAGEDVAELAGWDRTRARLIMGERQAALGALADAKVPTVAAITGYATGAGLELALGADRRVVGDNVKLALPQIHTGHIPAGGGIARLSSLVGPSKAGDLVLTGRFIDADEAAAMGLVDEVVAPDDVYVVAHRWARQFVGAPLGVLAAAKTVLAAAAAGAGLAAERAEMIDLFADPERIRRARSYLADGPG